MGAVGVAVEDDSAAGQAALVSRALDMPQPDLPTARAVRGAAQGGFGQATPQLQANNIRLAEVPAVVTNGPPLVVVDHLHPARTLVVPIYQPDPTYRSATAFVTTRKMQKWSDFTHPRLTESIDSIPQDTCEGWKSWDDYWKNIDFILSNKHTKKSMHFRMYNYQNQIIISPTQIT